MNLVLSSNPQLQVQPVVQIMFVQFKKIHFRITCCRESSCLFSCLQVEMIAQCFVDFCSTEASSLIECSSVSVCRVCGQIQIMYPWQEFHSNDAVCFSLHPIKQPMILICLIISVHFDHSIEMLSPRLHHCKVTF